MLFRSPSTPTATWRSSALAPSDPTPPGDPPPNQPSAVQLLGLPRNGGRRGPRSMPGTCPRGAHVLGHQPHLVTVGNRPPPAPASLSPLPMLSFQINTQSHPGHLWVEHGSCCGVGVGGGDCRRSPRAGDGSCMPIAGCHQRLIAHTLAQLVQAWPCELHASGMHARGSWGAMQAL